MNIIRSLKEAGMPSKPGILALFVVVAFFCISMASAYRSIGLMHENSQSVNNTLQVIALIKDLRTEMASAESGQRGYLLTSDQQYLEPYHTALARMDHLLISLSESSTEIPEQKQRFQALNQKVRAKIDEMQETITLVDENRRSEALKQVRTDRGVIMMREIRELIGQMESDERALLYRNRMESQKDREFILNTLIVTNILGLILTLVVFIAIYRHNRKITVLYNRIEQANDELEDKVEERTLALQQYSEELQRSNRELEEFAFVASHDLQEPLRKIRAFGDRLRQKYRHELGERGADYVERMHAASERMSQLIDDLLSFSRVSTRQQPFEEVDLNKVLVQVQDDLEYAIEDSGATIKVGSLPCLDADASQLGQLFMNLIGNSIKFRRADVPPVIEIISEIGPEFALENDHLYDDVSWCRLRLIDNGIGFDEQYADKVFNLFQRLHGRDEYTGTGIGLALCRKIIERHGGKIEAKSQLGVGSEFIIHIPLQQPQFESSEE